MYLNNYICRRNVIGAASENFGRSCSNLGNLLMNRASQKKTDRVGYLSTRGRRDMDRSRGARDEKPVGAGCRHQVRKRARRFQAHRPYPRRLESTRPVFSAGLKGRCCTD
jgi:hypothetical protein